MNELLKQIEDSLAKGNFYLALFATLTLPDICGAIEAEDGWSRGERYKAWFDLYVAHSYNGKFGGEQCYAFRCSALHQGKSEHKKLGYERIVFVAPERASEYRLHLRTCTKSPLAPDR